MQNNPETDYKTHLKTFSDLSTTDLYEIIKLRVDVFVVEQDCPYSDLDGKDYGARHYYYQLANNRVIGYVRILDKGVSYKEMAIGRVIIDESYRHLKLGSKIMNEAIDIIKGLGETEIRISAQKHLKSFYGSLGFKQSSEEYLEDNIPHIQMFKQ